jgi:hypothetical protein
MNDMDSATQELLDAEYTRALAVETYFQTLDGLKDGGPVKALLEQARNEAMTAMHALSMVDPFKGDAVRDLQWRVRRYEDLCQWVGMTLSTGESALDDLTEEQRVEYATLIRGEPEEKD